MPLYPKIPDVRRLPGQRSAGYRQARWLLLLAGPWLLIAIAVVVVAVPHRLQSFLLVLAGLLGSGLLIAVIATLFSRVRPVIATVVLWISISVVLLILYMGNVSLLPDTIPLPETSGRRWLPSDYVGLVMLDVSVCAVLGLGLGWGLSIARHDR